MLHLIEDHFEPGSRGQMLKNKLGITSKREMDRYKNKPALLVKISQVRKPFNSNIKKYN